MEFYKNINRGPQAKRSHARLLPVAIAILVLAVSSVPADRLYAQGRFGFGLVLGQPTGLAWKYKFNRANALDGAIGFSSYDRYRIHLDYLWHAYPFQEGHLALHYGVGGGIGFGEPPYGPFGGYYFRDDYFYRHTELGFAARGVIGLTYDIPRSPVDLFFEIAPIFVAAPTAGFGLDLGVGARVYP
jgi:hypothetical protein